MGTLYAIKGNIINSQEPLPIPVNFMIKLWENPDPTSDFAQQQITLSEDATNYEFLMIELKYMKSADYRYNVIGHTGNNIILSYGECGSKGTQISQRNLYLVSGYPNKVLINNCELATGSTASTTSNDHCIPLAIYGFNTQVPMQSGGGNCLSYNPETDYFGMSYNGVWHDVVYAGFQFNRVVYDSGEVAEYAIPLTVSPYSKDSTSTSATIGTGTINIVSQSNNVDGNDWRSFAVITSKIFNPDDLRSAGITKMCASIKSNNSGYPNYGVSKIIPFAENSITPMGTFDVWAGTQNVTDTYVTTEYDLSTIVDNFRIGVGFNRGNGSLQQTTYVKKIWFE